MFKKFMAAVAQDGEFADAFGMAKAAFPDCADWKRTKLLKAAQLF